VTTAVSSAIVTIMEKEKYQVGRCRLTVSHPSRKRVWFQRLKLQCDEPLSNFAFNVNLRRYNQEKIFVYNRCTSDLTSVLTWCGAAGSHRLGSSAQSVGK
jgi:hypothetical protein